MKLVTFRSDAGENRSGWIKDGRVYDMALVSGGKLPDNMLAFLSDYQHHLAIARKLEIEMADHYHNIGEVELLAPLPNPRSVRDFMAFEEHVSTIAKNKDEEVAREWYELPAFYFTNHQVILGTEQKIETPPGCKCLDYELEIACIIGKEGKDIQKEYADDYIAGYSILNDWSARDLQMKEMKIGLGPAKGKDFATSIGPYIVTKDELELYRTGNKYDLTMTASVNGKPLSIGNFKDIHYSFAAMIERASAGVTLYPGDIIGSGTVGTGCILELGPDVHRWLQPGDEVELEITGLGKLVNQII